MTKYWYQSKTVWLNVVSFLLLVVSLPEFISLLPVGFLPYLVLLNSMGNLYLRMRSDQPSLPIEPVFPPKP